MKPFRPTVGYVVEYYLQDNDRAKYAEVPDAKTPLQAIAEVKFTEGEENVVAAKAHVMH